MAKKNVKIIPEQFVEVVNGISEVLSENDNAHLEYRISRVEGIYNEIIKLERERKEKGLTEAVRSKYNELYRLVGGKTAWHNIWFGRNVEMIIEKIKKVHVANIEARNFMLAQKLVGRGIMKIEKEGAPVYADGTFQGYYVINTNAGRKHMSIQVIAAGGYNIQCLHYRTLVHVYK